MQIGFFSLLTLLFVGLKLGGIIAWSWFWALSPMLAIPAIILLLIILVAASKK